MIVLLIILYVIIGAAIGTILKLTFFKNDEDSCPITSSMLIWPFILILGGMYYLFIFIKRIISNFVIHLYFKLKHAPKCHTCKHCKNYQCDKTPSFEDIQYKTCEHYQLNKFWIFKIDLDQ